MPKGLLLHLLARKRNSQWVFGVHSGIANQKHLVRLTPPSVTSCSFKSFNLCPSLNSETTRPGLHRFAMTNLSLSVDYSLLLLNHSGVTCQAKVQVWNVTVNCHV